MNVACGGWCCTDEQLVVKCKISAVVELQYRSENRISVWRYFTAFSVI